MKKSKKTKYVRNAFAQYLEENKITLMSIEDATHLSYSTLIKLKKKNARVAERTIMDVADHLKMSAEELDQLIEMDYGADISQSIE